MRSYYPRPSLPAPAGTSPVLVQVDRTTQIGTSQMWVGWTTTQRGLGSSVSSGGYTGTLGNLASMSAVDGDATALAQALAFLGALDIGEQHTTDFGGGIIWPDPTVALDYTQPFLDSTNAPYWYALDYRVKQMRASGVPNMCLVLHRLVPPWATVKSPTGTPGTASSWITNTRASSTAQGKGAISPPYVGTASPWTDTIDLSAYPTQCPGGKPPGYTGAMDGNSIAAYIAVQIAKRYPDVTYFVVSNESNNAAKGYSCYYQATSTANPLNSSYTGSATLSYSNDITPAMDRYTDTYNAVYSALKAYNSALQVGGPYYTMGSVGSNNDKSILARFFSNCTGIDFIALDGTNAKTYTPGSGGTYPASQYEQLDLTVNMYNKYATDIIAGVRDAGGASTPTYPKAYGKPIWAIEYYLDANTSKMDYANTANYPSTTWTTNFVTHEYLGVGLTSMLAWLVKAGVAAAIRWQAESNYEQFPRDGRWGNCGNQQGYISQVSTGQGGLVTANYPAAWSNYGGHPFPAYWGALWIKRYFGRGTALYSSSVTDPAAPSTARVEVLASDRRTLLINKWATAQSIGVSYNGGVSYNYYNVPAYGVVLLA